MKPIGCILQNEGTSRRFEALSILRKLEMSLGVLKGQLQKYKYGWREGRSSNGKWNGISDT